MKPHALVLALSAISAASATAQTMGDRYGYDRNAYVPPSAYGAPYASQQAQPAVGRTLNWSNKSAYSAPAPAYDNRYQQQNYSPVQSMPGQYAPGQYTPGQYPPEQYAAPARDYGQAPYAQPQPLPTPQRQAYAPQYAQPERQAPPSYSQPEVSGPYQPQTPYYDRTPPSQAPQRQAMAPQYSQPYEPPPQQAPRYGQPQRQVQPTHIPQPQYSEPQAPQRQADAPQYDQAQPTYTQPPPYTEPQAPRFEPTTYIPPSRGPTTYIPVERPAMIRSAAPERNGAQIEMSSELSGGPPQPVRAAPEQPQARPMAAQVTRIPAGRPAAQPAQPVRVAQAQLPEQKSQVHYYFLHWAYGLTPDTIPAPDPNQKMVLIGPGDSGQASKDAFGKDDDSASEKPF